MSNILTNIISGIEAGLGAVKSELTKLFGGNAPAITAAILADIKLIGSGLTGALTMFESVTGLDPAGVAKVTTLISGIEASTLSIATVVDQNVAKPVVEQIVTDFTALEAALTGLNLPAAVTNVLLAVKTLMPYVEMAVGMLSSATVLKAANTGMEPDAARNILESAATPTV